MRIDPGAQALRYWEQRQAASANNLANLSTPGFKAERTFARLLDNAVLEAGAEPDFTPGVLEATGRPLDVALVGEGFLEVTTEGGKRWTRNGSLTRSADGVLTDTAGNPVTGEHGRIILPDGEVEISPAGDVVVDGERIDRIVIRVPANGQTPEREGATYWSPTQGAETAPTDQVLMKQGHLESSNVDSVSAMVEMIEIQRAYSAVQKSMSTGDDVMQTITTEIGRVG